MFFTIIIFLVVLSVLVFVHELGHFMTARRFGVRADEFGFGFPPRAFGFYRNRAGKWVKVVGRETYENLELSTNEAKIPAPGSTIYSVNWLPIGGFVKIKGENGEEEKDQDSFGSKPIWQRTLILSAGVLMNVVLAWFLFSVGYMIGMPQSTADLSSKAKINDASVAILEVAPGSAAASAGLMAGDYILAVNGEAVALEQDVQDLVGESANEEISLRIIREGQEQEIAVTPGESEAGRGVIGVSIMAAGTVSYPFFSAIWEGAKTTGWLLKEIILAFVDLIKSLFGGPSVAGDFAGPIGIASITGQAARLGFAHLLQFTALLSLNLAVINILPFPALDGGRILFLIIEKAKGRPVRRDIEAILHNIGFILLIALIIFVTYKDIIKLF